MGNINPQDFLLLGPEILLAGFGLLVLLLGAVGKTGEARNNLIVWLTLGGLVLAAYDMADLRRGGGKSGRGSEGRGGKDDLT